VAITATAGGGYSFSQFTGTTNYNGNPYTVTMSGPVTETVQFVSAAPIFTISPTPPPPYNWQQVQQYVPMVYTVLPPAGYIGTLQLGQVTFTCSASVQVTGVNVTPTGNPDGSLTITVTEDPTLFPLSPCYAYRTGPSVMFRVNLDVYGMNPNVSMQYFSMPLQVMLANQTISLSAALVSKTANTQTYAASVTTVGFTGPVTVGLASGSCATLMGSAPTVQLTANSTANTTIPLLTAGCAAGTNQQVTFTATGSGVSAPPVTLLLQTTPAGAVLTNPPPGATVAGGSTTFSWNAVTGATQYSLSVGKSLGGSDVYNNGNLGNSTTATVTLPTSGVVYATLGSLVNNVWQTTQCSYPVNSNPSQQTLTLVRGPGVVRTWSSGLERRYAYYFTGGDATTVSQVSTNLTGVTARIVSATTDTVTVGLTAPHGTAVQQGSLQLSFKAQAISSSAAVGSSDFTVTPSEIPAGTVSPYEFVLGVGTDEIAILGASLGPLYVENGGWDQSGSSSTIDFYSNMPLQPGSYCMDLWGLYYNEAEGGTEDVWLEACGITMGVSITLNPGRVLTGVNTTFSLAAVLSDGTAATDLTYQWDITAPASGPSASISIQGSCQNQMNCTFQAGSAGGRENVEVTVSNSSGTVLSSYTAQITVVQIQSVTLTATSSIPPAQGSPAATISKSSTTAVPTGPLQWPSETAWRSTDPAVLIYNLPSVTVSAASIPPATNSNPDVLIAFKVVRASDDNTAIGSAKDVPSTVPQTSGSAQLNLDSVGSFEILAFIDGDPNGVVGERDTTETGVSFPLILVKASVQSQSDVSSKGFPSNISVSDTGVNRNVSTGYFSYEDEDDTGLPEHVGMYMAAALQLIGGGGDGTRGTNRVFGGWIQNITSEASNATYMSDPTSTWVLVSNPSAATTVGQLPIFLPSNTNTPAVLPPPLLDTGNFPPGQGGYSSLVTTASSDQPEPLASGLGASMLVEGVDSPNTLFPLTYPELNKSGINQSQLNSSFCDALIVWTNISGNNGASAFLQPFDWQDSWTLQEQNPVTAGFGTSGQWADSVYGIALEHTWQGSATYDANKNQVGEPTLSITSTNRKMDASGSYSAIPISQASCKVLVGPIALAAEVLNAQPKSGH